MFNYETEIKEVKLLLEKLESKSRMISNIRLFVGILGIFFFILSLTNRNVFNYTVFICFCIIFVVLIIIYDRISTKKEYLQTKLIVMNKSFDRDSNSWSKFDETGAAFLQEDSYLERNLDIFGNNSLYQYLCVANTPEGKRKLASFFTEDKPDIDTIKSRQKAVQDLLEKEEFDLEFQILSTLIDKKNGKTGKTDKNWFDSFLEFLDMKESLVNDFISLGSFLSPIMLLVSIYLNVTGVINIQLPIALLAFQTVNAYYVSYKNRKITKCIFHFCSGIENYLKIIKKIEQTQFTSKYLKEIQKKLGEDGKLTKGISKLHGLNDALTVQANPYVHIILQIFLMYDIHCIHFLEKWKKEYGSRMHDLFQVIGEIEALLSLATIGRHREVNFPVFVEGEQNILEGQELTHPLIEKEKAIANSFYVKNGIEMITGSNMSGKTTFMRTVGVNTILAYAGAPVCAKSIKLSVMKIFTSMRVMDDVSKGISSFYGEVLRIKEMIDYSKKATPMLVLVDEIFKGTNSADRIVGAKEIIKGLNKNHIIALITTHDFELCKLIEDNEVVGHNYHFEEYYESDKIYFDYKLKEGKCRTTNAKYILEMAGLLE